MPEAFVTTSAGIFPQFREFERFTTACMNAFVGPGTGSYLDRVADSLREKRRARKATCDDVERRRSDGARGRRERPVTLLLSGPAAAGILGGQWAGQLSDRERLITFDMGGTSADIGIVTERGVAEASARDTWVAGYPLLVPMLDVHTIGAGGGSIALRRRCRWHSGSGLARAGARTLARPVTETAAPDATITDANVVLGRIDPDRFLGGEIKLDREQAIGAVQRLADDLELSDYFEAAEGTITIANANMARAIRSRTIEKGHDPSRFHARRVRGRRAHSMPRRSPTRWAYPKCSMPPYPGITSATGPADQRPQVRPDAHGLSRSKGAIDSDARLNQRAGRVLEGRRERAI